MEEDDIATRQITKVPWLPPVKHAQDLPTTNVAEGTLCFVAVDFEEEVWEYHEGAWRKLDEL